MRRGCGGVGRKKWQVQAVDVPPIPQGFFFVPPIPQGFLLWKLLVLVN